MTNYNKLGQELSGGYFASGQEYEMDLDQAIEFLSLKMDRTVFKTNEDGTLEMSFTLSDLLFLKSLLASPEPVAESDHDVVIVEVRGGCVVNVSTTKPDTKIVIVDFDIEDSERNIKVAVPPDNDSVVECNGYVYAPDYVLGREEANKFIETIENQKES